MIEDAKQKQKDKGIIMVLLDRFNKIRLPQAKAFKKKVDAGEVLGDFERDILEGVKHDGAKVRTIVARNPEYQELYDDAYEMWEEIIEKDAQNQKKVK